jgi:adenylate cyclase
MAGKVNPAPEDKRSIRLDPHNRMQQIRLNLPTLDLYFSHKYEASAAAVSLPRTALGQLGRTAEAKEALERVIEIGPASFDQYVRQRMPWHRPEDYAHMLEGLRKAGREG